MVDVLIYTTKAELTYSDYQAPRVVATLQFGMILEQTLQAFGRLQLAARSRCGTKMAKSFRNLQVAL
jgi:hypothetical protein